MREGRHLPDFIAFKPVFAAGSRIAITCALIHHVDVGGGAAGGYNARAVEVFQEGLRIPPVRIMRAGEMQDDLFRSILANVRDPETFRGDFLSQIAALEMGRGRSRQSSIDMGSCTDQPSSKRCRPPFSIIPRRQCGPPSAICQMEPT